MFSDPSAIMKLMEMQKQQQGQPPNGMGPQPLQGQAASTADPSFSKYAANIPAPQVGGLAKTDKGPIGALANLAGNIPIAGQASQALLGAVDGASGLIGGILQAPLKGLRSASHMFDSPTMALRNRYL